MLTERNDENAVQAPAVSTTRSPAIQTRLARVMCIEWLGQTVASLCWITSVFAYGITSSGDYLQLFAASAWLLANIATAVTTRAN